MKKVTAIFISLLCIISLNLAFAGGSQTTKDDQSKSQPMPTRLRFQR